VHFKGKIYPRDSCGLGITSTAAVGPLLPLEGRDGEEFPLVTELCGGAGNLNAHFEGREIEGRSSSGHAAAIYRTSFWKSQKHFCTVVKKFVFTTRNWGLLSYCC